MEEGESQRGAALDGGEAMGDDEGGAADHDAVEGLLRWRDGVANRAIRCGGKGREKQIEGREVAETEKVSDGWIQLDSWQLFGQGW